jgi:hypothetical protein
VSECYIIRIFCKFFAGTKKLLFSDVKKQKFTFFVGVKNQKIFVDVKNPKNATYFLAACKLQTFFSNFYQRLNSSEIQAK